MGSRDGEGVGGGAGGARTAFLGVVFAFAAAFVVCFPCVVCGDRA
jgi:hypothetical protein